MRQTLMSSCCHHLPWVQHCADASSTVDQKCLQPGCLLAHSLQAHHVNKTHASPLSSNLQCSNKNTWSRWYNVTMLVQLQPQGLEHTFWDLPLHFSWKIINMSSTTIIARSAVTTTNSAIWRVLDGITVETTPVVPAVREKSIYKWCMVTLKKDLTV